MINELLKETLGKCEDVPKKSKRCHVPSNIIQTIEQELLMGHTYRSQTPKTYPTGKGEDMGFRSVKDSRDVTYHGMKLRVGSTELHISDNSVNINAVVMMYMGQCETQQFKDTPVQAHSVSDIGGVFFLENGVVSVTYASTRLPSVALVHSVYPENKEGYAALPYPESKIEIDSILKSSLTRAGIHGLNMEYVTNTKAFRAIPDLMMLCVDTYKNRQ